MQFAEFKQNGFGILENVLGADSCARLIIEVSKLKPSNSVSRKNESVYGVRNLLDLAPAIKEFSKSEVVTQIAAEFLGENAKVVRAIFFDKTAEANWKVPWHQDLTIAVKEKSETEGFAAWTHKACRYLSGRD